MSCAFVHGDSRLEGMQSYIDEINPGVIPIYVCKHSGHGMYDITTKVLTCLEQHPTAIIIIAVGICDFTSRRNKSEKYKFMFETKDSMTSYIVNLFEESNIRIKTSKPVAQVTYCDLIGMDLTASKYNEDPLPGQQDILNNAITDINTKIVEINRKNNIPTPWIAKRVHIPRKNGYHHHYCRLSDGIHWSNELKKDCAGNIVKAIMTIN